MKSINISVSKITHCVIYCSLALTAISVLIIAIGPDRFIALGDASHHTGIFAPQRALIPWLGVLITMITTVVHHYVMRNGSTPRHH